MYAKQFVIARNLQRLPENYKRLTFGSWYIGLAPDLEHTHITLPDNRNGLVFGHPIDCFGALAKLAATGNLEYLYDLAGSYIALFDTEHGVDLYLDACGSLPAVYAPELSLITANPNLIPDIEQDPELLRSFPIDENAFFPFGFTPKRNVWRLLPNHRLSLERMAAERHWPTILSSGKRAPHDNIVFISDRLRAVLNAVAERASISLPLTAGYDSRALLACAPVRATVSCFTSLIDHEAAEDAQMARELAGTLGMKFQSLSYVEPSTSERERWLDSTGHCVGGRASYNFKTVASVSKGKVLCLGLAGEVGRAYYGSRVLPSTQLTAERLLNKLALPISPSGIEAATNWLEEVKDLDAQQILDLLYIEVRLGCWAAPQMIADGPCLYRLIPFNQRPIYEHALDVPYPMRRAEYIPTSIVQHAQRPLSRLPYNPSKMTLRKRVSGFVDRLRDGVHRLAG